MYNQTTILGNAGADAEMRFTKDGTPVTSFSVAVSKKWTDKSGNRQEHTTWYRVSAWNKLAEPCGNYIKKGKQVMVIGEMQQPNVWTDRDGKAHATLELRARTVKFLGSRQDPQGSGTAFEQAGSSDGYVADPSSSNLNDFDEIPF